PITIEIPKTNTAAEWNAAVAAGAEKAGVPVPTPGGPAAAPAAKKEDDAPTLYESSIEVNGKTITVRDTDPAKVIEKLGAPGQAAQAAAAAPPAAAVVEEPKPAFTEQELFDIGLKVQKGDVSGLHDYIKKSGIVQEVLKEQGIDLAKVNKVVTAQQ